MSMQIAPETDWTAYRAYQCRHCYDDCINRRDSEPAETKQCWSCYRIPTL